MSTTTHVPRVAWDAARAIVHASGDRARAVQLADWFTAHAGQPFGQQVMESYHRLVYDRDFESVAVEAGVWRVRLDDLLHHRPDLVEPLAKLVHEPIVG